MTAIKLGVEPRSRSLEQNVDEGSALCISNGKSESSWETSQSKPLCVGVSLARKFVMRIEFAAKGWQGPGEVWSVSFCINRMQNLISSHFQLEGRRIAL
jgi:hypothetical protein